MREQFIIINADDFGLTTGICRSILDLMENGAISSLSMMIASENAYKTISSFSPNSLSSFSGVHLQLTKTKSLSPKNEVSDIVDNDGNFINPRSIGYIFNQSQIYLELKRQIETVGELLAANPTHLDSHHGIHRIPEIFEVYKQLGVEFNIPMRGSNESPLRDIIIDKSINATVAIVRDWTGSGKGANTLMSECLETSNKNPLEKIIEVVTHPGYPDRNLSKISTLNSARKSDHDGLLDLASRKLFEENNFKLISFHQAKLMNGFNRT